MDRITLKNFRCFREEQSARLAPLTLLVGENSTGKTSFMAMIRALGDVAYSDDAPSFKENPYDLGSFDEIAHYRGGRGGGRADTIEAGFDAVPYVKPGMPPHLARNDQPYRFEVIFERKGTAPFPAKMRLASGGVWAEVRMQNQAWRLRYGTPEGTWERAESVNTEMNTDGYAATLPPLYDLLLRTTVREPLIAEGDVGTPLSESGLPADADQTLVKRLFGSYRHGRLRHVRAYASGPVRSRPRRTYDTSPPRPDAEGDHVPMYLHDVYINDRRHWKELKKALERFGTDARLFDEISIKPLGRRSSEPFQLEVRKYGRRAKGPWRNLIDVGYGVSQVLPVIAELFRPGRSRVFLLQQPEVHLHPSSQAALGTLFCQVAGLDRQLIVETHSDHLLDRVRMDVRDGATDLKPEDVSILFFERSDLEVNIHSLRIDQEGNVLDAPPSYGRFFLQETRRSLGL